jgi:hypothetical protein
MRLVVGVLNIFYIRDDVFMKKIVQKLQSGNEEEVINGALIVNSWMMMLARNAL